MDSQKTQPIKVKKGKKGVKTKLDQIPASYHTGKKGQSIKRGKHGKGKDGKKRGQLQSSPTLIKTKDKKPLHTSRTSYQPHLAQQNTFSPQMNAKKPFHIPQLTSPLHSQRHPTTSCLSTFPSENHVKNNVQKKYELGFYTSMTSLGSHYTKPAPVQNRFKSYKSDSRASLECPSLVRSKFNNEQVQSQRLVPDGQNISVETLGKNILKSHGEMTNFIENQITRR